MLLGKNLKFPCRGYFWGELGILQCMHMNKKSMLQCVACAVTMSTNSEPGSTVFSVYLQGRYHEGACLSNNCGLNINPRLCCNPICAVWPFPAPSRLVNRAFPLSVLSHSNEQFQWLCGSCLRLILQILEPHPPMQSPAPPTTPVALTVPSIAMMCNFYSKCQPCAPLDCHPPHSTSPALEVPTGILTQPSWHTHPRRETGRKRGTYTFGMLITRAVRKR